MSVQMAKQWEGNPGTTLAKAMDKVFGPQSTAWHTEKRPAKKRQPAQESKPNKPQQPSTPASNHSRPAITEGALPTPEAAASTGMSPKTLETMRCRGGGPPFVKLGRRVVYRREDLDVWLAVRVRKSTSDAGG